MMFKRKGCEKALCSRFFLVLLKAVVLPWFFFNPFLALSPLIHLGCPIDCISSIEKIKGEKNQGFELPLHIFRDAAEISYGKRSM